MNLREAIYRAMTGRTGSRSEPQTEHDMMAAITKAAGGRNSVAADIAGIPRSTWRYMVRGRTPAGVNQDRLESVQRAIRVSPTRHAWLTSMPGPHIVIAAVIQVSSDIRIRKIYLNGWPRAVTTDPDAQVPGVMGRVYDRWVRGDDRGAEAALLKPIEATFGHSVEMGRVFSIRLFHKESEARADLRIGINDDYSED